MFAGKWNFKKKEYLPYKLPEGASMYEGDLNKTINCAECGSELMYAQSYTSRRIHNHVGLGFAVCEECYSIEWKEERSNES